MSQSSARLLPAAAKVRFVPELYQFGTVDLTYYAWDQTTGTPGSLFNITATGGASAFSAVPVSTMVAVNHVNHAPTWTGSGAAFSPVLPGDTNPAGDTVSAVFGNYFHDIDPGTTAGIAIVAVTGAANGAWQYSTLGGSGWTGFNTVSTHAALLLAGSDLIRYVPNAGFAGSATLQAYAWDGSTGNDGGTANLTGSGKTGGATAFSTTTITATMRVNTAPVLNPEFPEFTPPAGSGPGEITAGPDGNLWFTDAPDNKIGEINPLTRAISEFVLPTANAEPNGITAGPDGNLWFTEFNSNKIGQINRSTHASREFTVPTANSGLAGITDGPDGQLWFTESNSNKIGLISPSTHAIGELTIPTGDGPQGITAGPDGNIWFTEQPGSIGEFNLFTQALTEFTLPTAFSFPEAITPGPDGNLWFTEHGASQIGEINPSTHAIREFPAGGIPFEIAAGSDGNLWFTEAVNDQIGMINPSTDAVSQFGIGGGTEVTTAGSDGNLWFTTGNRIGAVVLYGSQQLLPVNEDAGSSSAVTVKFLLAGAGYGDPDAGALGGGHRRRRRPGHLAVFDKRRRHLAGRWRGVGIDRPVAAGFRHAALRTWTAPVRHRHPQLPCLGRDGRCFR